MSRVLNGEFWRVAEHRLRCGEAHLVFLEVGPFRVWIPFEFHAVTPRGDIPIAWVMQLSTSFRSQPGIGILLTRFERGIPAADFEPRLAPEA